MVDVTLFTDPACPFAFSAEPARLRLRWHYGDGLRWQTRMILLTLEPGHADDLAKGASGLQRTYGMPIRPGPYERPASGEPACRAVVAARLHAPQAQERMLRALRVRVMAGGLLDDPELLAGAAHDAGLDPADVTRWSAGADVAAGLHADVTAARDPSPAARALDHKLGGPEGERRYSAPSYELVGPSGQTVAVPGFSPVEAYEAVIANLDPSLPRRPKPRSVTELLEWAEVPLATAEVIAIMEVSEQEARSELAAVAECLPAGADAYWTLP